MLGISEVGKRRPANCEPCSVLNLSGMPRRARRPSGISTENAASICLTAAGTTFLKTVFGFGGLAWPSSHVHGPACPPSRRRSNSSPCQISGVGSDFGPTVEVPHSPTETELSVAVWSDVFDSSWLIAVAGL